MKYRIASLSALLVIGLLSSASALAAPPGNSHGFRQPLRQSAPPAAKKHSTPPSRQHYAPPPRQTHAAPQLRKTYAPPPPRKVYAPPSRQHYAPPPRQTYRQVQPLPRPRYVSHQHYGRPWQMGRPVPRTVVYHEVSSPYVYGLAPPPRNHRYVRVGRDILLLAIGTGLIVNALYDIAD